MCDASAEKNREELHHGGHLFLGKRAVFFEAFRILKAFRIFEAFMVVRTEIGQFLLSTARPTLILLNYAKKSATSRAGAEKNRKEEVTVAIFQIPKPFCELP